MFVRTRVHAAAERAFINALAQKFRDAHIPAKKRAVLLCNEDTGDLKKSITIHGPRIELDGIYCAISAGGVMGRARGEIITYGLEHHLFNPYLTPVSPMIEQEFRRLL